MSWLEVKYYVISMRPLMLSKCENKIERNIINNGRNLTLLEITLSIAERAGRLRGRYTDIKTIDALQIPSAIEVGADAFPKRVHYWY